VGEQQRRITIADGPGVASDAPPIVDVILLTNDEKLLATLREASAPHHALWHAASADGAIELLLGGHCGILIADLALLHGDVLDLLERLQAQFPELIILATGRRDEEVAVAAAISSGRIYRFLHKPVSPARASLFLGTATRRYGELREVESLALATIRQLATRPRLNKWGLGVAALAIAGVICLWWALDRQPERGTREATQNPADDYLARAQSAFKAGKLSDGTDHNALALYRAALVASPGNTEARAGIERVIATLDKRVVAALRTGNAAAARLALNELERAHPAHPHLASLHRQLQLLSPPIATTPVLATQPPKRPAAVTQSASPPPAAPATAQTTSAPTPVKIVQPTVADAATPQIDRARARLAASQFIAPVDDSAATYLRRARELGEDETLLKIVATDLGARLLDQVRQALVAGDLERSQNDYSAAAALDTEFELGLPELGGVGQQLKQAQPTASAEPILPGTSSAEPLPQQPTAAQTPSATATAIVSAANLRRVREVAAVYPREAEVDRIEGWVEIDFNIAVDGTPQDLTVRAAQPRGTFDNAALEALREWRFEPVLRNGEPVVQPATLRLQFSLKR
jgi:TonB family protein